MWNWHEFMADQLAEERRRDVEREAMAALLRQQASWHFDLRGRVGRAVIRVGAAIAGPAAEEYLQLAADH